MRRSDRENTMRKSIPVLSAALLAAGSLFAAMPAMGADMPVTRRPAYVAVAPVYVAPVPVYIPPPECHLGRERFFDGYAWRSRDIQVCD
jgi:hypothetical protein